MSTFVKLASQTLGDMTDSIRASLRVSGFSDDAIDEFEKMSALGQINLTDFALNAADYSVELHKEAGLKERFINFFMRGNLNKAKNAAVHSAGTMTSRISYVEKQMAKIKAIAKERAGKLTVTYTPEEQAALKRLKGVKKTLNKFWKKQIS